MNLVRPILRRLFRAFSGECRLPALALAVCGLLLSLSGARAQPGGTPGQFDFYVLSLSWSPTYCEDKGDRAAREPQCSVERPYAFVVHGLWPQYERGFPRSCQVPAPYISNSLVRSMLDVMPSRGLVIHEWKTHGTCSGLAAEGYFAQVRAARDKVTVPEEFKRLYYYRTVSPADVEKAFLAANPGLTPDMMAVECDRRRLKEVRVCLSRDLSFRACPDVDRRACRLDRMVMPPMRGAQ
ncbi:ribonuclease T2 [Xanthobacter autotrophicus DSM 431]